MNIDTIYYGVINGEFDDDLELLKDSVEDRLRMLGRGRQTQTSGSFAVGDTVKFNSKVSPKYLIGREFTIAKVNTQSVVASMPNEPGYGRFAGKQKVRIPKSLVEAS